MTSKEIQGLVESAADPKQTPPAAAARNSHRASSLERNSVGKDSVEHPTEVVVSSSEEISVAKAGDVDVPPMQAKSSTSALSPLEEHRVASLVDVKEDAPYHEPEEKVSFEKEAPRVDSLSSENNVLAKVQDTPENEDMHHNTAPPRLHTDDMSDMTYRGIQDSVVNMMRPMSPSTSSRGLISYIRKASILSNQFEKHKGGQESPKNDISHGQVNVGARGKLTNQDEEMLSDSEADYDAFDSTSDRAAKKLLSPNIRFFRWYAVFMLLALLLFIFFMPFRIGFLPDKSGAWVIADIIWNIVFFVEILIRLNTGFVHKGTGTVIYNRRAIFWHYAQGWLLVDILAAFPFTFLPGLRPKDDDGNHEIAYFLSLPKMFQLYGLMNVVQESLRLHDGAFMAIRTLISVIATAHLFGCGWYILATRLHKECEDLYVNGVLEGEIEFTHSFYDDDVALYISTECPWVYRNNYYYYPVARRYLGSAYWALTTLTTVGYGDLSARTVDEQIYSMCVQIVGVAWYGYIVGTWATVLNSFNSEEEKQRNKMREVVAFSKAADLLPDLAKKVRQHFRFALSWKDNWITFNENEIVGNLPASLRADVLTYVHRNTISQIPWFEGKNTSFIADVVVNLKPRLFKLGDVLFRQGTQPEELFFITSGRIMLQHRETRVGYLKQGQIAGLLGLISCENHKLTAVVVQKDLLSFGLSHVNFEKLTGNYPKEMKELVRAAKSLVRRISQSSAKARIDFMANSVLAQLIAKGQSPSGTSRAPFFDKLAPPREVGAENFNSLTQLSIGRDFTQAQPALSPDWLTSRGNLRDMRKQHASPIPSPGETFKPTMAEIFQNSSDADTSSAVTGAAKASTGFSEIGGSVATAPSENVDNTGYGNAVVMSSTALEDVRDVVGREVSQRMSSLEAKLFAILERLEGALPMKTSMVPEPATGRVAGKARGSG